MADLQKAVSGLDELAAAVSARGAEWLPEYRESLTVLRGSHSIDLKFFGSPNETSYFEVLDQASRPDVAPFLRSLSLAGPDQGANGTKSWNLEPLVAHQSSFERLELLAVQQNGLGDHNRSVIGDMYEENGVIAKVLARAPRMRSLQVPSAPDASFFKVHAPSLQFLSVDAGYDTQNFIANLAKSSALPGLQVLEWGEYCETYISDWTSRCTPTADYSRLFSSDLLGRIARFVWRNPVLSEEEIAALKAKRSHLQLLVIRCTAGYA